MAIRFDFKESLRQVTCWNYSVMVKTDGSPSHFILCTPILEEWENIDLGPSKEWFAISTNDIAGTARGTDTASKTVFGEKVVSETKDVSPLESLRAAKICNLPVGIKGRVDDLTVCSKLIALSDYVKTISRNCADKLNLDIAEWEALMTNISYIFNGCYFVCESTSDKQSLYSYGASITFNAETGKVINATPGKSYTGEDLLRLEQKERQKELHKKFMDNLTLLYTKIPLMILSLQHKVDEETQKAELQKQKEKATQKLEEDSERSMQELQTMTSDVERQELFKQENIYRNAIIDRADIAKTYIEQLRELRKPSANPNEEQVESDSLRACLKSFICKKTYYNIKIFVDFL